MAGSLRASLPPFGRGALSLFITTAVVTAVFGDQAIGDALRLQPGLLLQGGGLWQPLTANFVFPEGRAEMLAGTLLMQWFIGSQLERFWGTKRYLLVLLGCGTLGFLAYALISPWVAAIPHGGSTAIDLSAAAAYGVVFGKRELALPGGVALRSRTLAMILVGAGLLVPLLRGASWSLVVPWVVAIVASLVLAKAPWRDRERGEGPRRKKPRGKASHLRVVKQDQELLN